MDDLEFAARCVSADKTAWEEFLEKYSRLIYSYIHSIIRIKGYILDPSVIEDIFNEIISSLIKNDFKKLRSYRGKNGCSLASWLRQVTVNYCLSYLRSNQQRAAVSIDSQDGGDGSSLADIIPYRGLSPADSVLNGERSVQLADCIEGLNTDDKFFVELNIRQGLSLEQLKDILGISRGAADMRRNRIIGRLRDCFKQKGFEMPSPE